MFQLLFLELVLFGEYVQSDFISKVFFFCCGDLIYVDLTFFWILKVSLANWDEIEPQEGILCRVEKDPDFLLKRISSIFKFYMFICGTCLEVMFSVVGPM